MTHGYDCGTVFQHGTDVRPAASRLASYRLAGAIPAFTVQAVTSPAAVADWGIGLKEIGLERSYARRDAETALSSQG